MPWKSILGSLALEPIVRWPTNHRFERPWTQYTFWTLIVIAIQIFLTYKYNVFIIYIGIFVTYLLDVFLQLNCFTCQILTCRTDSLVMPYWIVWQSSHDSIYRLLRISLYYNILIVAKQFLTRLSLNKWRKRSIFASQNKKNEVGN